MHGQVSSAYRCSSGRVKGGQIASLISCPKRSEKAMAKALCGVSAERNCLYATVEVHACLFRTGYDDYGYINLLKWDQIRTMKIMKGLEPSNRNILFQRNIFNMKKEDERTGTVQPLEEVSHRNLILQEGMKRWKTVSSQWRPVRQWAQAEHTKKSFFTVAMLKHWNR